MHEGHIRLFRRLRKSPYYTDSQYVHLWIHLIMSANWSAKRVKIKGSENFVDLLPGQFLTSRDALSQETGINSSKVERILKAFKSEQQIEQQTFTKYRVISILNWHRYQHHEQQNEQQMNNRCTTDEQQMNTTNNNNNKEEQEIITTTAANKLSIQDIQNLMAKYIGKLMISGGQINIIRDMIKSYPPERIHEAFEAAGAAGNVTSLNWIVTRLKESIPKEIAYDYDAIFGSEA